VDVRDSDIANIQEALQKAEQLRWKSIIDIPIVFNFIEKSHSKDIETWEKFIRISNKGYVTICYEFFEGDEGILEGENLLELPPLWVSEAALEHIEKIGFDNINLANGEARKLKKYVMLHRLSGEND